MKKVNNFVLCLILVFITSSCKSQISYNGTETIVNSIKDSIVCDGEIRSNYNLPFFSFKSKKSSLILNNIIKKEVEDFIFTDGESLIDSTSLKKSIKIFTDYVNAKCCLNKCYSFNNSDYKIHFINKHIISIQLDIETYTAYLTNNSYVYNFDIDNSKLIADKDFFNNMLIKQIQKRLNIKYLNEFEIIKIPAIWYITKNEQGISGIEFSNGLNEDFRSFGDQESLFDVFFTFEELKPYIKEGYKAQLGL